MSETITNTLEAKKVPSNNSKVSLLTFKQAIFSDLRANEASQIADKIFYDLLGSDLCEDTSYRNEVLMFHKVIKKMIIGINENMNPNDIHVLEICIE